MNRHFLGAAATALLLVTAFDANAQTRAHSSTTSARSSGAVAMSPSTVPLAHGPAISGVCIFSNERVIGTSMVGKAWDARLQQLRAQAAAELSGEQNALKTDVQAFQSRRASLTQEQQQQQAGPLQQREEAFNQKAQQRQSELEYTARHQMQRMDAAITPIVQSVYQERHCSLLLNADSVMGANPAMDLSDAVVQQLNTRMNTITFDREAPPAAQQ